jgi:hypothetical protein
MTQNKQYVEQHKNKQYIEQHKNIGGLVRAMPHLCGFYPGVCLTTEEKAWKNLSQGSFATKGQKFKNAPSGCLREMLLILLWCDGKE